MLKKLFTVVIVIVIALVGIVATTATNEATADLEFVGYSNILSEGEIVCKFSAKNGENIYLSINHEPTELEIGTTYVVTYETYKLQLGRVGKVVDIQTQAEYDYNNNTLIYVNEYSTQFISAAKVEYNEETNKFEFLIAGEKIDRISRYGFEYLDNVDYVYVLVESTHYNKTMVANFNINSYENLLVEGTKDLRPDWAQAKNWAGLKEVHCVAAVDSQEYIDYYKSLGKYVTISDINDNTITFSNGLSYTCYDNFPADADCYYLVYSEPGVIAGFQPVNCK